MGCHRSTHRQVSLFGHEVRFEVALDPWGRSSSHKCMDTPGGPSLSQRWFIRLTIKQRFVMVGIRSCTKSPWPSVLGAEECARPTVACTPLPFASFLSTCALHV